MKKGKLNNKGFVLVETLIVSVFIVSILAVLYNNFYPLMGEYEKREVFDDIDGKYATYWVKRVIQHESTILPAECDLTRLTEGCDLADPSKGLCYCKFNCEMIGTESMKAMCHQLIKKTQIKNDTRGTADVSDDIPEIYLTTYNLEKFKNYVDEKGGISGGMQRYLKFLPNYRWDSLNNAKYRVVVEFYRTKDDNDYLAYSTFEVKKDE